MGSIGDVTARMTLDGSQFEAGTKKAEQVMTASSRGIQMSAEKAAAAQALAARLAGDAVSTQSLRIIAARVNEKVASVELTKAMKLMKDGYGGEAAGANLAAAALQRLTAAKVESAAASAMEAVATHNAGHAAVSEMNATSAAVRSLEGNPGIRAVERFLTTIPGVGAALQMAFPLIGGVAFGAMVGELIKKVYDFEKATESMAREIVDGFEQINAATRKAAISLDITSDKLQIQIAKLEHKPENLLKLALDESRLSAYNLTEQLRKSNDEAAKLMKEKSVGVGRELFSFVTGANVISDNADVAAANAANSRVDRAQIDARDRLDRATPGAARDAVEKANQTAILAAMDTEIAKARSDLKAIYDQQRQDAADEAQGLMSHVDYSARTSTAEGQLKHLQDQRAEVASGFQVTAMTATEKKDEDTKRLAEEAKQRGTAAAEAMRKAAEVWMKAFEAGEIAMQAAYGRNLTMDATYWNAKLLTLQAGSANYAAVLKKAFEADEKEQERLTKAKKKYAEYAMVSLPGDAGMAMIQRWAETLPKEDVDRIGPRWEAYNREAAKAKEITAATAASMALASIEVQVATGALDRHTAAMRAGQIHADGYKAKLDILAAELARINADPELQLKGGLGLNPQAAAQAQGIQNQMASTMGERDAQGVKDAQSAASATMLGGATDALEEFIAASLDGAKAMKELASSTLNELNKDILTELTTRHPRHAFQALGGDIARNVAGSALKGGEASLMKALGFGGGRKPTGTASDPLHVVMAAAGAASSAAGGLLARLLGIGGGPAGAATAAAASGGATSAGAGFLSQALGFATRIVPMMAEGGVMTANSMAIVGERGPELFMPGSSGHVVPSHALSGGGVTQNFHVDARGSTDPAQTAAMVHRVMRQYAPGIVAASVKAVGARQGRLPSSRR
jgi:hypothetical protein